MRLLPPSGRIAALLLLLQLFLIPFPLHAGSTITQTLFGPERLDYATSTYNRTFTCPSTQGSFTLGVVDGDGNGHDTVSSANIYVNGTRIIKSSDFNSNTTRINKSVTNLVSGNNTLAVQINTSSPSSYLVVTISGVYTLDVKITSPVAGAQFTTTSTPVQGTYLSYSSNFTIEVDNVSATANSGTFNIGSVPLHSGSNLLQAIITTSDGLTDTDNVTVNDNLPPIAEAGPSQNVRTGDSVYLDGRGSSDPENASISYLWSLISRPTGSQSTLAGPDTVGPVFVPDLPGSYVAQLVVSDGYQNSSPDNVPVVAVHPNTAPTAIAGVTRNVTTGDQVQLDGSGSYDPDQDPITYSWDFIAKPQQSQAVLSNPAVSNPGFTADASGAYILELVVNDGQVSSNPDNVTIVAIPPNVPPTANAGPDAAAARNILATLDGGGSYDSEGGTLSYAWVVVSRPPGSTAVLDNAAAVSPSFVPDVEGDYVFRLAVNDGVYDSAPDTVIVTAINIPPVALATAASSNVPVNTTVSLDGSGSHDANGDPLSYSWTILAAPAGSSASPSPAISAYPTLVLDQEGSYSISLTVNDGQVSSSPASVVVTAFIPPVGVPSVVGMAQAAAQDAIIAGGLVVGSVGAASSDTVPSGSVIAQSPDGGATVPPGSAVNLTVSSGPVMVPVPVVLGMTLGEAQNALSAAQLGLGTISNAYSNTVASGRVISQDPASGTSLLHHSAVSLVLSQGEESVVIPPDPASVAPPPDPTIAPNVASSTRYLYSGNNPIQVGVAPEVIDSRRAAAIRGKAITREGQPLSGVTISIDSHPEYGHTVSRLDGMFDMVVNGGGRIVVNYSRTGYLPAKRYVETVWQEYARLPDVAMIPYDNAVTTVDLTATSIPIQVVRGNPVSDADGTRRSTLLIASGTGAELVFPDGSARSLPNLGIRSTEYTVGPNGPKAMPAPLPPTTGYTYCVELTADEALATGAEGVRFDRPLYHYVENFLGFPVGVPVPVGFFDKKSRTWIPSDNGRVIEILSVVGEVAVVDSTGNGTADNSARLAWLGMTEDERRQLAILYAPGTTLWRAPVAHFSTIDMNFPVTPVEGAVALKIPVSTEEGSKPPDGTGTIKCGSIIECQQQGLGETIPIVGTPYALNYRSQRTSGRTDSSTLYVPITRESVPPRLIRVEMDVFIAGRLIHETFDNSANQTYVFEWDGLRFDGIPLHTPQKASVQLRYIFPAYYLIPPDYERVFGISSTDDTRRIPAPGRTVALQTDWEQALGGYDSRSVNLGGWTLTPHHVYDPANQSIYFGDGSSRGSIIGNDRMITTFAGVGNLHYLPWLDDGMYGPSGRIGQALALACDEAGNVIFSQGGAVRKLDRNIIASTIVRNRVPGDIPGDGGPASLASIKWISDLAIAGDNSIYLADVSDYRIRKIDSDGKISTVVGTGEKQTGLSPYNVAGTEFMLGGPMNLAVGPYDSVYFIDQSRVWKLGSDNLVRLIAGGGSEYGEGIPATKACIYPQGLAVGQSGIVYFYDSLQKKIRSVSQDNGCIRTIAGGFPYSYPGNGDGGPALNAYIGGVTGLAVSREKGDTIYFSDDWYGRVRVIRPDGTINQYAANGLYGFDGDGGAATGATFRRPGPIALGPDGSGYISDLNNQRIRKVGTHYPGLGEGEIAIGSDSGSEVFVFSGEGKHLETRNARTGKQVLKFGYDIPSGFLVSISDADNNTVRIDRDTGGALAAIDAPGGQRTVFGSTVDGYLSSVTRPGGDRISLDYWPRGLLKTYTDFRGYPHAFTYDGFGRLEKDTDPGGGFLQLDRQWSLFDNSSMLDIFTTTALGRSTHHTVELLSTGKTLLEDRYPSGSTRIQDVATDGTRNVTLPDGTVLSTKEIGDPRFGMQSPYIAQSTIRTPDGLVSSSSTLKTVSLQALSDPWSLISASQSAIVNGRSYASIYDNATRRVASTSPAGRQSAAWLDDRGRLTAFRPDLSFEGMLDTRIAYDNQGRLWKTGNDNGFDNAWVYAYDEKNRVWKITDPYMRVTEYGYDNVDRVNSVKLPSNRIFGFEYDAEGNRIKIVMPKMTVHSLGYSPVNLDNSYSPPENPSYSHSYSPDKEWKTTTLPGGRSVIADYGLTTGRLSGISYPEASISYGYLDNDDRVRSITRVDAGGTQGIDYGYDGFLPTWVQASGMSNGEYRYSYDNNFFVTKIALDNVWILLSRDPDGLMTGNGPFTISRGGPAGAPDNVSDLFPRECGLDESGQPRICMPGSLIVSYGYDNVGRMSRRTSADNTGTIYHEEILERDLSGRIARKTERMPGNAPVVFDYFHDLDGQLDNVIRDGSTLYEKYVYDLNGNRTNASGPTGIRGSVAYDEQDRETGSAVFDIDGYLAMRGLRNYRYSARGELLEVIDNTTGQPVIRYAYDGLNRRIASTIGNGTTQYLYGNLNQPFQVTASRAPDNTLSVYYYDGFGALYSFERNGDRFYVASDHLGTPKVVIDNAGNIRKAMEYDSWGVKIGDTAPEFDLPIGFAGGLADNATSLVRFGFRDYEPESGRWLSKDPIFFEGGQANLYVYVENDPINWVDPDGLGRSDTSGRIARDMVVGGITGGWGGRVAGLPGVIGGAFAGAAGAGLKDVLKDVSGYNKAIEYLKDILKPGIINYAETGSGEGGSCPRPSHFPTRTP